jgi:hypothetical protein
MDISTQASPVKRTLKKIQPRISLSAKDPWFPGYFLRITHESNSQPRISLSAKDPWFFVCPAIIARRRSDVFFGSRITIAIIASPQVGGQGA